jgi:hypothetical protein
MIRSYEKEKEKEKEDQDSSKSEGLPQDATKNLLEAREWEDFRVVQQQHFEWSGSPGTTPRPSWTSTRK